VSFFPDECQNDILNTSKGTKLLKTKVYISTTHKVLYIISFLDHSRLIKIPRAQLSSDKNFLSVVYFLT